MEFLIFWFIFIAIDLSSLVGNQIYCKNSITVGDLTQMILMSLLGPFTTCIIIYVIIRDLTKSTKIIYSFKKSK